MPAGVYARKLRGPAIRCHEGHLMAETRKQDNRGGFRCRECEREYGRNQKLKQNYEITKAEYATMLLSQGSKCAICKGTEMPFDKRTGKPRSMHVDHSHITGKLRGILCQSCSTAIGSFKENIELLTEAAIYLEKFEARESRENRK